MASKKNPTDLKITITEGAKLLTDLIDALNANTEALNRASGYGPDEARGSEGKDEPTQEAPIEAAPTPAPDPAAVDAAPAPVPTEAAQAFPPATQTQQPVYQAPAAPQQPYYPQTPPVAPQYTQSAAPISQPPVTPGYPVSAAGPAPVTTAPTNVTPNAAPEGYTLSALSRAGAELCERGLLKQCVDVLKAHGVDTVELLKPADYPAVAAELRALGANI